MCLGIPGQITEIVDLDSLIAKVDIGGVKRNVIITCVVDDEHPAESCIGDWVLVHKDFAMVRLNAQEAAQTLALLEALGDPQAELDAMHKMVSTLERSA